MKPQKIDVQSLSPQEKLELLGEIWDSLTESPDALPLTDPQRVELDRRLDELDHDSVRGIPWDEVIERIRRRAG